MAGDLHCHTIISDGSIGIEELIAIAKRRGISTISVTDHDTPAGSTRALIIGKRQQLNVIHGVELSSKFKKREEYVNILCYDCEVPDRLEGHCRRVGESRREAATEMIRKVMRYYPITPDLIGRCATGSTNIFPQHIMHALIDAGYTDTVFGDLYEKLFSPEQGTALVYPELPDTKEVINLIQSAGGIAVLAKPTLYEDSVIEEIVAMGLDGIETIYPECSDEETEKLEAYAKEKGLLTTGGSDFHGMYAAPPRAMGSYTVSQEQIDALLSYDKKKRQIKQT